MNIPICMIEILTFETKLPKIFFNEPTPASFSFIFGLFKQTIQLFTTNQCEKCPTSIWRQDSNPRPLEHESSPITTRPGLLPQATKNRKEPSKKLL